MLNRLSRWWQRTRRMIQPRRVISAIRAIRSTSARSPSKPRSFTRSVWVVDAGRSLQHRFVPLPDRTPFTAFELYRYLRDTNPDISDAVWTWKRLCQTGFDLHWHGTFTPDQLREAQQMLADLNRRMNSGQSGLDGLLDIIYTSLFTFGASAIEVVWSPQSPRIYDIVPVDVWTIRFQWENDHWQAYQEHPDGIIPLPPHRVIYIALDRDGTNPYGKPMLRALFPVIKVQQQLMEDMSRAMHNAGWARLHVQYKPDERLPNESEEEYQERMEANLAEIRDQMANLGVDQNVVTYDNVNISVVQGSHRFPAFYETQRAIEEQIITGTHMMPILMGRNYGTTETYGTVQYEILNRQVDTINRTIAQLLERIYNLELSLAGSPVQVQVTPKSNRSLDLYKIALAETQQVNNLLRLYQAGLLTAEDARQRAQQLNLE